MGRSYSLELSVQFSPDLYVLAAPLLEIVSLSYCPVDDKKKLTVRKLLCHTTEKGVKISVNTHLFKFLDFIF